ncbi:uncharacterized protein LOC115625872 isoform X2 [Scaptodrosophila lebanonensis]|uniref:Uncharacterized protein LOC115625872 isoform X2 n=1 Tax=Drosophila lebanonensis TaxID=7225 RepID=A0A6J2TLM1_DROLE|nr:uncharacterized protein LOC115625872 isoform X2 [Scaptodrosophila lebanonensis]
MFIYLGSRLQTNGVRGGVQLVKKYTAVQQLHTSARAHNYAAAAPLPLPENVDAAELTQRFSAQRSRDITATVMSAQAPISTIDITTDNSLGAQSVSSQDAHVQSYDCFGAVSLNSAMQSNVPQPFGGMHKFSHLNMPGGQWSQEYKFMSEDLTSSHYRALRDSARAEWAAYDQNATMLARQPNKEFARRYSTQATPPQQATKEQATETACGKKPSRKEQLKNAVKEYGSTIVVFHVGISLISLGGFYLLVSSGINVMPVLEYLGIESQAISDKIATGSTFVVAYAVHKVFAPVRLSITLGSAPFIVRYLRSKGFLKVKAINNKT